jgi:hypothetical protein
MCFVKAFIPKPSIASPRRFIFKQVPGGKPSQHGLWLSYGLGSENKNLHSVVSKEEKKRTGVYSKL